MADYSRVSIEYLLREVGRKLENQPEKRREIAKYREYANLWHAPGPLSAKAEAKESEIRRFCIGILNSK